MFWSPNGELGCRLSASRLSYPDLQVMPPHPILFLVSGSASDLVGVWVPFWLSPIVVLTPSVQLLKTSSEGWQAILLHPLQPGFIEFPFSMRWLAPCPNPSLEGQGFLSGFFFPKSQVPVNWSHFPAFTSRALVTLANLTKTWYQYSAPIRYKYID